MMMLWLCGVVAVSQPAIAQDPIKPNIVLIMADDLGFSDLGCYGGEINTPVLDGLAAKGLRFSRFYNTAKCHSSRVSLLTGLYCGQAGNAAMDHGVTIAEMLRGAGYFTAMSGKWHLKGEPTDRGFDRYFGHLSGATNFFKGDDTFRLNGKPWNEFGENFYTTDVKTDFALRFLDEARETEKPFFLYIAYNAPHYPLQAPAEEIKKYRGKYRPGWDVLRQQRYERQVESGLIRPEWKLSQRPDHVPAWNELDDAQQDWEDHRMATYAAMVDRLDQNIGRVVAHLKATDELENTLFMFCSDNGACPFERTQGKSKSPSSGDSYWTYDTGWAHVGNTPFRWYKQNQHEGGISSPLIVHWPEGLKTKPGAITHQPGHLIDFMVTCMEVGVDASQMFTNVNKSQEPFQGKSLFPVFQGKQRESHPYLYFHFSNNRAIMKEQWKLVSARGGPWELYDLHKDRTELDDLASQQPDQVKELSQLWHKVAKETDRLPERQRKPVGVRSAPWKKSLPK